MTPTITLTRAEFEAVRDTLQENYEQLWLLAKKPDKNARVKQTKEALALLKKRGG